MVIIVQCLEIHRKRSISNTYTFYLASVSMAGSLGILVQWFCDNNILSLIRKGINFKEISILGQNEKKRHIDCNLCGSQYNQCHLPF